jgi:hypothetical protein
VTDAVTSELDHSRLLRPFLARRFRSRYADIPPGSARRAELLDKLCHRYAEVLDWRHARPTPAAALEGELRALGAGRRCYCYCAPPEFDGREVPLAEALAALCGYGLPVLLVCHPGSLAYFEPEYESGAGKRFIICRPSTV